VKHDSEVRPRSSRAPSSGRRSGSAVHQRSSTSQDSRNCSDRAVDLLGMPAPAHARGPGEVQDACQNRCQMVLTGILKGRTISRKMARARLAARARCEVRIHAHGPQPPHPARPTARTCERCPRAGERHVLAVGWVLVETARPARLLEARSARRSGATRRPETAANSSAPPAPARCARGLRSPGAGTTRSLQAPLKSRRVGQDEDPQACVHGARAGQAAGPPARRAPARRAGPELASPSRSVSCRRSSAGRGRSGVSSATGEPLRRTHRPLRSGRRAQSAPASSARRACERRGAERLDQRFGLHAEAGATPVRPASQRWAPFHPARAAGRARRQGTRQRAEARRPRPTRAGRSSARWAAAIVAGVRAVQPAATRPALEVGESPGAPLDGRADRFQSAYDGSPSLGNPHGVGGREPQIGAAGERLSEDHPAGQPRASAALRTSPTRCWAPPEAPLPGLFRVSASAPPAGPPARSGRWIPHDHTNV